MISPLALHKYLYRYGWTPISYLSAAFHEDESDLTEMLMEMEEAGIVVHDETRGVNVPLSARGGWAHFWARIFGY